MTSLEEEKNKDEFVVIQSYFQEKGFVDNQLAQFNNFITFFIPEYIINTPAFVVKSSEFTFSYRFINVFIHNPSAVEASGKSSVVYPYEARLRNFTYSSPFFITVEKTMINHLLNNEQTTTEHFLGGHIPIMYRSCRCNTFSFTEKELISVKEDPNDPGGYFIVNGTERVAIAQERMATKKIYVFKPKVSSTENIKDAEHYATILSVEEKEIDKPINIYIVLKNSKILFGKTIFCYCPYFKIELPFGIFLKALGLSNDQIKEYLYDESFEKLNPLDKKMIEYLIKNIIDESYHIEDKEEAYHVLGLNGKTEGSTPDKISDYAISVMEKEFLPHIGITQDSFIKKAEYMVYAFKKLLRVYFSIEQYDDHDHYKNKRCDFTGTLMTIPFKRGFTRVNREMQKMILKKISISGINIGPLFNHVSVSKELSVVLSSGNLEKKKTGVVQVLNRYNYVSVLSHLRQIVNPISKKNTLVTPRQLHNSSFGIICPSHTPEGQSCGLTKNLALLSTVTVEFSDIVLINTIESMSINKNVTQNMKGTKKLIIVNEKIIGSCDNPEKIMTDIKNMRRSGFFPVSLSISTNGKDIFFNTDGNRLMCPFFIVKDNKIGLTPEIINDLKSKRMTWSDLISNGIIEYLDTAEMENCTIAKKISILGTDKLSYTHCIIHPSKIFGITVHMIPYLECNPAARVSYESNMSKQSKSVYSLAINERMDTMGNMLHYPQKPLVGTTTSNMYQYSEVPAGQNATLAIAIYGGFNTEDGLILNKSSIDRGFMCSTIYSVYTESETKDTFSEEKFGKPDDKRAHKLDGNGFVKVGIRVGEGDMIIGKMNGGVVLKKGEDGIIDKVVITNNLDGTRTVHVKIRQYRPPKVGDKFASRIAQKGICTIMLNQEDMPFTSSGIVPDVIMNPHGFAGRMTGGQLRETLHGKQAALKGKLGVATPFADKNLERLFSDLRSEGFEQHGWELMYNGMTGEPFMAMIMCFGKGTKVLMSTGQYENIEDIRVGQKVMGDNGIPTTVTNTTNGYGKMYKISPIFNTKSNTIYDKEVLEEEYIVNGSHILVLRSNVYNNIYLDDERKAWVTQIPSIVFDKKLGFDCYTMIERSFCWDETSPSIPISDSYEEAREEAELKQMQFERLGLTSYIYHRKNLSCVSLWIKKGDPKIIEDLGQKTFCFRYEDHSERSGSRFKYKSSKEAKKAADAYLAKQKNDIIWEVSVENFLKYKETHNTDRLKLFWCKSPIREFEMEEKDINFETFIEECYIKSENKLFEKRIIVKDLLWLLGYWIGDGTIKTTRVSIDSGQEEVYKKCVKLASEMNMKFIKYKNKLCGYFKSDQKNIFQIILQELGIYEERKISAYLYHQLLKQNDELRLAFLSGIIDADGCVNKESNYIIKYSENKKGRPALSFLVRNIARSLGLTSIIRRSETPSCTYLDISIYGFNISNIVPVISYKKIHTPGKTDLNRYQFTIECIGNDNFYGITVDNESKRFLLSGLQVVHNCGPCFYQRLKHMAADKLHARGIRGPFQPLMRQPNEGRSREGGLRWGEMEKDVSISHACPIFLKERLFDMSDKNSNHFCSNCGKMGYVNYTRKIFVCKVCKKSKKNIVVSDMPYATKILMQELLAMNISCDVIYDPDE